MTVHKPARIEERSGFNITGISAITTNAAEAAGAGIIAELWSTFYEKNIVDHVQHLDTEDRRIYGCYTNYEKEAAGRYTILLGCSVPSKDQVPAGLDIITLPPSVYAVFTTARGPIHQVVLEAWQAIWKWADSAAVHEMERTYTGDFEQYDERSADPDHAQVDIYIAVGPKRLK